MARVVHAVSLRREGESESGNETQSRLASVTVLEQIAKNIRDRKLFCDGDRILVAVSGGLDSMALLHALHQLAHEHTWKLTVAHFNHQLRSRASDADEKLVRNVAKTMRLKFVAGSADVKAHATRTGKSIEMAARELRHAFLARAARKLKIKTIVTAHHADDQVELFFLRLLRGASTEGLAGMRWRSASPAVKTVQLARPLLNISRQEMETFARANRIAWREDKTNVSTDFLRNRIRRELLPLLEKNYQPGLRKNILRLTELLRAETEVVAHATNEALSTKQNFNNLPVAIQRRLLQQQLFQFRLSPDFATIETLRLKADEVIELNPTTRVARDQRGRLRLVDKFTAQFSPANRTVKLKASITTVDFENCQLTFQITGRAGTKLNPRPTCESFDADKIGRVITLRNWQPGDRYQPIGSESSRKLQDMFVDLKVPKNERHSRIVATTAHGEILWIEGLRISEKFKLTAETKRRLVLKWSRQ